METLFRASDILFLYFNSDRSLNKGGNLLRSVCEGWAGEGGGGGGGNLLRSVCVGSAGVGGEVIC